MRIAEFQQGVMRWMEQCFGNASDGAKKGIRNFRFFEEATELVQAAGMTREEAHRQVDYTFDRPPGEPGQELGGTLVTLAAWAGTHGLEMAECGPAELARIDTPEMIATIRAKQASKPGEGGPPRPTNDPIPDPAEAGAGIQTVVIERILPTAIWIESDICGSRHVMLQHEGMHPFCYASFAYDYAYTDNSGTWAAATQLAKSLGATEPIEHRQRTGWPGAAPIQESAQNG